MKKFLSMIMATLLGVMMLTSCGKSDAKSDWEYIKDKGELIIGYTDYAPMNYVENGKLTGFDTDFAEAVCAKLGIKAKFVEVNWKTKETELSSKNIDCLWNGFSVTEERKGQFDFADSYMNNWQVVVIQKANMEKYKTITDMNGVNCTAEAESAGESALKADNVLKNNPYVASDKQTKVLLEVKSGTSTIGVVDYIMAKGNITDTSDYSDLYIVPNIKFELEEYAVGFRKNSPKTLEMFNKAAKELSKEGKISEIAKKYNLDDQLIDLSK